MYLMIWPLSSDSLDLFIGGPAGAACVPRCVPVAGHARPVKTYPFDQFQTSNKHFAGGCEFRGVIYQF